MGGARLGAAGWGTACVLAASVLWGTTGTAATFAPRVGPLAIGAAAMGLGGLLQALAAARAIRRQLGPLRAQAALVAVGAAAVALYPLAFYSSMRLAGVATGTVVSIGSAPLASALIERAAGGPRLTARWKTAAALGLGGTILLCAAQAAGGGTKAAGAGATVAGVVLGLAAGGTYALYSWTAHRVMRGGVSARAAMGAVFGLGGLALVPVLVVTGAPLLAAPAAAGVGAYLAVVPMFAGYLLFGQGLARVAASTATALSLLEPAVAAVLAVAVVGERLPAPGWAGLACVAACLAVLTTGSGGRRETAQAAADSAGVPPGVRIAERGEPHPAPPAGSGGGVLPGAPLAAGGQYLAQQDGVVGHDAVHAQVEQADHLGTLVHRPGVHLQAQRVRTADEPPAGHARGHLRAAHARAGEATAQRRA